MSSVDKAEQKYDQGMCDFLGIPEERCQGTGQKWKDNLEQSFK